MLQENLALIRKTDPEIADAMEKIMDEDLRHELINKGRIRRKDFSWDKAAEGWWRCIELTINN